MFHCLIDFVWDCNGYIFLLLSTVFYLNVPASGSSFDCITYTVDIFVLDAFNVSIHVRFAKEQHITNVFVDCILSIISIIYRIINYPTLYLHAFPLILFVSIVIGLDVTLKVGRFCN